MSSLKMKRGPSGGWLEILNIYLQQGDDDNDVSRECANLECISASPPETIRDVGAATHPDADDNCPDW